MKQSYSLALVVISMIAITAVILNHQLTPTDQAVVEKICGLDTYQVENLSIARIDNLPYNRAVESLGFPMSEKELVSEEFSKFYDENFRDIAYYVTQEATWNDYSKFCNSNFNHIEATN